MIRTKFHNKVLNLALERKRKRLRQRKAERERLISISKTTERGYLIGLMLNRNSMYLTKSNKEFLDRLHAGDGTFADREKLLKLITTLMPDPRSVIIYVADPDELDDGGLAILHSYKKRKVA